MIHNFRVCIELSYDDENGEYAAPTTKEIEQRFGNTLYQVAKHMGFTKDYNVEAERID